MAKFLRTNGVSDAIDRIISEAKNEILIVSPYLKVHTQLLERMQQAARRNVRIILIYGKTELNSDMDSKLGTIDCLERYYKDDLHAKCYMNENTAIITSMNLHDYSARNNREMGILIEKSIEKDVYMDIREEVKSILGASTPKKTALVQPAKRNRNRNQKIITKGFCIRCGEEIPLNPNRPFCKDCYDSWNQYCNPDYHEKFCHSCGFDNNTSMNRPLCRSCFKELTSAF